MSRFNVTVGSEGAAIGVMADMLDQGITSRSYTNITTGTSSTASAATFVSSAYYLSGGTTYALTTPTAAQIVAAITNPEVSSAFIVTIHNANSGTATLTAGSGVTITGLNTATTGTARSWIFIVTNATAGSEAVVAVPKN